TRYVAMLLEAVGIHRIVVVDVHNLAAYQNAFRCSSEHLEAKNLFIDYFVDELGDEDLIVVSPDVGGIKRAGIFREALMRHIDRPVASAFMEKKRSAGIVSGEAVVGDVKNKTVIIIDDLISTGGTIIRTANACKAKDCNIVYAAATHGVFVGGSDQLLTSDSIEKIVITNTIPSSRLKLESDKSKLVSLDISPLLSEAIKRINSGNSIVELLES
ncbi:MAG: ribose-phosphate diphosphokinase, partial [Gammaproteobacteria bacterium]